MKPLIQAHLDMGCTGILAMPNTKPPVAKILEKDELPYLSIEEYLSLIRQAGGDTFSEIIVPLYLTKETTPAMIAEGAKSGLLKACKYYPPHGTTGAGFSAPFATFIENGVFAAMAEHGIVLCIHGEEHDMPAETYFSRQTNAEEEFYRNYMPRLIEKFPTLKVVCEHITTAVAADFVQHCDSSVAASVTPQHLIYTVGHLVQGLKYHLYCMPLVKFEEDRNALQKAVTNPDNTKFFAGTDSAAHTEKATACGCAAGCFTGGVAPQLYAEAFEMAGLKLDTHTGQEAFKRFLCLNGPVFYGLPPAEKTFTLIKKQNEISALHTDEGDIIPLPMGMDSDPSSPTYLPWSLEK